MLLLLLAVASAASASAAAPRSVDASALDAHLENAAADPRELEHHPDIAPHNRRTLLHVEHYERHNYHTHHAVNVTVRVGRAMHSRHPRQSHTMHAHAHHDTATTTTTTTTTTTMTTTTTTTTTIAELLESDVYKDIMEQEKVLNLRHSEHYYQNEPEEILRNFTHRYRSAESKSNDKTERFTSFDWLDKGTLTSQGMARRRARSWLRGATRSRGDGEDTNQTLSSEHRKWIEGRLSGEIPARQPLETETLKHALCPKLIEFADEQLQRSTVKQLTAHMFHINKTSNVTRERWESDEQLRKKAIYEPSAWDLTRTHVACVVRGKLYWRQNYDSDRPETEHMRLTDMQGRVIEWMHVLYNAMRYRKLDNDACFYVSNVAKDAWSPTFADGPLPLLFLQRPWSDDSRDTYYWPEQDFAGFFSVRLPPYAQVGARIWNHKDWTEPGTPQWRKRRLDKGFAMSMGQTGFLNRHLVHRFCHRWPMFNDAWDVHETVHTPYKADEVEQKEERGFESYSYYQYALFQEGAEGWSSSINRHILQGAALVMSKRQVNNTQDILKDFTTINLAMALMIKFCDDCYIPIKYWDDPTAPGQCLTVADKYDRIWLYDNYKRCVMQDPEPGSRGLCKSIYDAVAETTTDDAERVALNLLTFVRRQLSPLCYMEYMSRILAGVRQDWSDEISRDTSDVDMHKKFVEDFNFTYVDCSYLRSFAANEQRSVQAFTQASFKDVQEHWYDSETCLFRLPEE